MQIRFVDLGPNINLDITMSSKFIGLRLIAVNKKRKMVLVKIKT